MRKVGSVFIFLGLTLIAVSLFLCLRNNIEDRNAGISSDETLAKLCENIKEEALQNETSGEALGAALPNPYAGEMRETKVEGEAYIGYIAIPALGLELPVASEWSYAKLKKSPCRYSGSSKTANLTIAAHSYKRHFGKIGSLKIGDEIALTDADGICALYEVAAKEVLEPSDVEGMTDGKYALTLFTCTYDGQNRMAVRCDRKS